MSLTLFGDDVVFLQRFLKPAGLYVGSIDGIWGPKTDAAASAFEEQSEQIASELGRFDPRTERSIWTLHPRAQQAARAFLRKVLDVGIDARIISGTRTYAEQNALYKRGRYGDPTPKITNARGGHSNHNFGIAWDIGIFENGAYLGESPLYRNAAEIGMVDRLEWGGAWKSFQDRPHYQLATGDLILAVREKFENGQDYLLA